MKLIIDIPKEMIKALEQGSFGAKYNMYDLVGCVMNGTPIEQEPKTEWIPVKTRPMTEEETECYSEYTDMSIYDTYTILDCPLPDDGQEVLVSWGGNVMVDVFVQDDDGCYFEGVDIDEVDAWCPLPEPYKESEGKE